MVFADEVGTWMIPDDEKQYIVAYLASLAAVVGRVPKVLMAWIRSEFQTRTDSQRDQ